MGKMECQSVHYFGAKVGEFREVSVSGRLWDSGKRYRGNASGGVGFTGSVSGGVGFTGSVSCGVGTGFTGSVNGGVNTGFTGSVSSGVGTGFTGGVNSGVGTRSTGTETPTSSSCLNHVQAVLPWARHLTSP